MGGSVTATTKERLLKGARLLGEAWRAGERCSEKWRLFPVDADPAYAAGCACGEGRTRFCKAKVQWLGLAKQDSRDFVEDPYGLALAMTASEWDATGLLLKVEFPGVGVVAVGTKGAIPMTELAKVSPETLASFLAIFKAFPGSKVEEAVYVGVPVEPDDQFAPEKTEAAQPASEAQAPPPPVVEPVVEESVEEGTVQ